MLPTHAVGIDLGTTYSCIACLNEYGEPVTLANQEGELSTPSAVLFEPTGEIIVGTEALRNAVLHPDRVVMHAKRYMGDPRKVWTIDGRRYTPTDISALILKKLLSAAREQIGEVRRAVITVPAQFSERQRRATVEAGKMAGLEEVDIINEPVAAALCYVLGTEGLWFTELANEQRILVWDLGGGTFDLSLVRYHKNEVRVIASGGDLHLGGIDWNRALERAVRKQFLKDFGVDPGADPESLQMLALEVETAKRSLSVRPRTALVCQHDGHRKVYQIEQSKFEQLTRELTERTARITQKLLKDHNLGWAHVDVVLMTGGASRMPMVRKRIKELGGRTPNTSLSPDQSIAHGATYYAGMLLSNSEYARSILSGEASERLRQFSQTSVNARALGILVRDTQRNVRFPHYLIPANTPLPAAVTERFGTVIPNQRRVNLQIIESDPGDPSGYTRVGQCVIDELPPDLPEGSEIAVTIQYNEQALIHVEARDVASGKVASADIDRRDSVVTRDDDHEGVTAGGGSPSAATQSVASDSDMIEILCDRCGGTLAQDGSCPHCGQNPPDPAATSAPSGAGDRLAAGDAASRADGRRSRSDRPATDDVPLPPPPDDDVIIELVEPAPGAPAQQPSAGTKPTQQPAGRKKSVKLKPPPLPPMLQGPNNPEIEEEVEKGAEEFWEMVD